MSWWGEPSGCGCAGRVTPLLCVSGALAEKLSGRYNPRGSRAIDRQSGQLWLQLRTRHKGKCSWFPPLQTGAVWSGQWQPKCQSKAHPETPTHLLSSRGKAARSRELIHAKIDKPRSSSPADFPCERSPKPLAPLRQARAGREAPAAPAGL